MAKKGGHKTSFTWAEAVLVAGSEAVLTAGVKEKTWRWWQQDGPRDDEGRALGSVPAHRIVWLVKDRLKVRSVQKLTTPATSDSVLGGGQDMPDPLVQAASQLSAVFFGYGGPESIEWQMLIAALDTAVKRLPEQRKVIQESEREALEKPRVQRIRRPQTGQG